MAIEKAWAASYKLALAEKYNAGSEKYRKLFECAPDMILFLRMDGIVFEANKAAHEGYACQEEALAGRHIACFFVDGRTRLSELEQRDQAVFEGWQQRCDGSRFPVEVHYKIAQVDSRRFIIALIRDMTERRATRKQLQHLATHDFLTDIPNRYLLEKTIRRWLHQRLRQDGALLFIDIDNFKVINDTFGHAAGDRLLKGLVDVLQQELDGRHFLARLGGDEFAVLLKGIGIEAANRMAERLRQALEAAEMVIDSSGATVSLTTSIGIVRIDGLQDPQQLLACADLALYEAKNNGKNRVVIVSEAGERERLSAAQSMISAIGRALRQNGFVLQYQPIYTMQGQILHYEALLRMSQADGTFVAPAEFIPLAERCGLMSQIDRWVVGEVLRVLRMRPDIHVFVNLSGVSLGDAALLDDVEAAVIGSGIEAQRLGFEITETSAVRDIERAACWIRRLKELGCLFALDDFGVGFCSFGHLQSLPVDYVKIDGSFVQGLVESDTKQAIVRSIHEIASTLGKETIAEFVETEAVFEKLKEMRIDHGQGYLWGKPGGLQE